MNQEISQEIFFLKTRVYVSEGNVGKADLKTGYNVVLYPSDLTVNARTTKKVVITKNNKPVAFTPKGCDYTEMNGNPLGFNIAWSTPGEKVLEALMPNDTTIYVHFKVI